MSIIANIYKIFAPKSHTHSGSEITTTKFYGSNPRTLDYMAEYITTNMSPVGHEHSAEDVYALYNEQAYSLKTHVVNLWAKANASVGFPNYGGRIIIDTNGPNGYTAKTNGWVNILPMYKHYLWVVPYGGTVANDAFIVSYAADDCGGDTMFFPLKEGETVFMTTGTMTSSLVGFNSTTNTRFGICYFYPCDGLTFTWDE